MFSMTGNPNLPAVRRKANEMGATIVEIREGKKHTIVILQAHDGRFVQMNLSRTRIDPYIMEGWTRQALARTLGDVVDAMVSKRANDNDPRR